MPLIMDRSLISESDTLQRADNGDMMELRNLIHPTKTMLIVLIVLSVTILSLTFLADWDEYVSRPLLYATLFYTLVLTCTFIFDVLHPRIHEINEWFLAIPIVDRICSMPLVQRYRIDILFKSQVRLYFSIGINIGYILLNVLAFYVYDSYWFLIIATYYLILLSMCIILFRFNKRTGFGINKLDDLKITKLCAMILLMLTVILLIAVEVVIYTDAGYKYDGIIIYFMALYTLFTSGLAFINLVRFSKYGNFVVTIIRMVVVAAALVSILALETAILFQFGSDIYEIVKELIVVFSGIGFSTVIVGMALRVIALTSDEIRELKAEKG